MQQATVITNPAIQKALSKMKIISKYETDKRDQKRFAYVIDINGETFEYYGSTKDRAIERISKEKIMGIDLKYEIKKRLHANKIINNASPFVSMIDAIDLRNFRITKQEDRDNKVKLDALNCLVNDYFYGLPGDMVEFLVEFGYNENEDKLREGEQVFHQLKQNEKKLRKVFSHKELEDLAEILRDY